MRSVFGMGGAYQVVASAAFVCAIVFTNEALSRPTAERYAPLISVIKTASGALISTGHLFDPEPAPRDLEA